MWLSWHDVSNVLWPSLPRVLSGQLTHVRRRHPRRHHGYLFYPIMGRRKYFKLFHNLVPGIKVFKRGNKWHNLKAFSKKGGVWMRKKIRDLNIGTDRSNPRERSSSKNVDDGSTYWRERRGPRSPSIQTGHSRCTSQSGKEHTAPINNRQSYLISLTLL
jgi:hypothetical protein